ncbi:hypothetical protein E4T44_00759 [Aureobasidium sp. EXF-8845]|nr:hypothetical protein E4T44_00759 [Aureobasidium sp. EXF-8845]KAI4857828.1 hypothetical protein E4T45_00668 [Aureobasidium sp. EXF-8846]
MSQSMRWYYRQMDDPVLRRKLSDSQMRNSKRYYAALKQKGEYERLTEKKKAIEEVYRVDPQFQFARHMRMWLMRTSYVREGFNWKTHLPMNESGRRAARVSPSTNWVQDFVK